MTSNYGRPYSLARAEEQLTEQIAARLATYALFVGRARCSATTSARIVMGHLTALDTDQAAAWARYVTELLYPGRVPPVTFWPTPLGRLVAETWDTGGHSCTVDEAVEITGRPRGTIASWLTRGKLPTAPGSTSPDLAAVLAVMIEDDPKSPGRRV